ncbi:unnamed protein product [Ambrosiozyma monospora]|uniref:Unnamed protein product n=1 Tax=Ambrosiozyma monospora TaxID=43982 RepID=A0ACB5T1P5_AMBMO|nr:unnamed protein product [Ambrosiozyma monospora]
MYKPFRFICNNFLASLENLRILKVRTSTPHSFDIRNIQLPKHLTSFELIMQQQYIDTSSGLVVRDPRFIVLDSVVFPLNLELKFISFIFEMYEGTIVVDDWIGADVESVKEKIQVDNSYLPTWVLCDHDYSALENTLF